MRRIARTAYRIARSLKSQPISKQLPQSLVEDCKVCANRIELIRNLPKEGVVAELGTLRGDFARSISEHASPKELHLIDVDFSNFDQRGLERTTLHQGLTHEVLASFPDNSFDWIYVDADHSYEGVLRDIHAATPKLKPGGFLVFNDFAHIDHELGRYGVHRAVCDFIRAERWTVVFIALSPSALYDVALRKPEDFPRPSRSSHYLLNSYIGVRNASE